MFQLLIDGSKSPVENPSATPQRPCCVRCHQPLIVPADLGVESVDDCDPEEIYCFCGLENASSIACTTCWEEKPLTHFSDVMKSIYIATRLENFIAEREAAENRRLTRWNEAMTSTRTAATA